MSGTLTQRLAREKRGLDRITRRAPRPPAAAAPAQATDPPPGTEAFDLDADITKPGGGGLASGTIAIEVPDPPRWVSGRLTADVSGEDWAGRAIRFTVGGQKIADVPRGFDDTASTPFRWRATEDVLNVAVSYSVTGNSGPDQFEAQGWVE